MRTPIQDANEGAATQVAPSMKHAARAATVARDHKTGALEKQKEINRIASPLAQSVQKFMDVEYATGQEKLYTEAYHTTGLKEGLAEIKQDQKRTGFTNWLHNNKPKPARQGRIDKIADTSATAFMSEELSLLDGKNGSMSDIDYQKYLQDKLTKFNKENFADTPDVAFAFMKAWKKNSNELTKQQIKLSYVRQHQQAAKDHRQGVQAKITLHQKTMGTNPNLAIQQAKDIVDPSKRSPDQSEAAWYIGTVEELFASADSGSYAAISMLNNSKLRAGFSDKQRKEYKRVVGVIDTNNAYAAKTADNILADELREGSDPDGAYKRHTRTILGIAGRNTLTNRHRETVSKSDAFRGKQWEGYQATTKREYKEEVESQLENQKLYQKAWLLDTASMEGGDLDSKNIVNHDRLTAIYSKLLDRKTPLKVAIKLMENAKEVTDHIIDTATGDAKEREKNLVSSSNLLQAKYTLKIKQALLAGKPVDINAELAEMKALLAVTQDPNTQTHITNYLTSMLEQADNGAKEYTDRITTIETDNIAEYSQEAANQFAEIGGDATLTEDERDTQQRTFIVKRIKDLNSLDSGENQNDITTKGGKTAIKKDLGRWLKALEGMQTETDRRTAKEQKEAAKKLEFDTSVKNYEDAIVNGTSTPAVSVKQREKASDNIVVGEISTGENSDLTDSEKMDNTFSDPTKTRRFAHAIDKFDFQLSSPLIESGLAATFGRMFTDNPNPKEAQKWSADNIKAMTVMQVASNNTTLWNHLPKDARNKALYMIDAMHAGVDRTTAMRIANTPAESSNVEPEKVGKDNPGWKGIVDKLGLQTANDDLQSHARGMYDYLRPKLGHDQALSHVRKLVQQQDISTTALDVKHGASYPAMTFEGLDKLGNDIDVKVTLKDFARDFENVTVRYDVDDVLGSKVLKISSPANLLAIKLIGNAETKDGLFVRSIKEIPGGVTIEMIGDNLLFVSNNGTAVLTKKNMLDMVKVMQEGKRQHGIARDRERKEHKEGNWRSGNNRFFHG